MKGVNKMIAELEISDPELVKILKDKCLKQIKNVKEKEENYKK